MTVTRFVVICLAAFCLCSEADAEVRYTITRLEAPDGSQTSVWDVNSKGQAVGYSYYDGGENAYLWDNGEIVSIGKLSGSYNEALGINEKGQVVGYSRNIGGYNYARAFIWQNGVITELGIADGLWTNAEDINEQGQIVGRYRSGVGLPYKYADGVTTTLQALGGAYSSAYAINENGDVVGYAEGYDGKSRGRLWKDGNAIDLGTLGGTECWANDINDNCHIIGTSSKADGYEHAFLWQNNTIMDIGTLDVGAPPSWGSRSHAYGINNSGQIVGDSYAWVGDANGNRTTHAFLWESGLLHDLNDLIQEGTGWELVYARAISDAGHVVGVGGYNGIRTGFLLTPVPEPSSLLALFAGLAVVDGAIWRGRGHSKRRS